MYVDKSIDLEKVYVGDIVANIYTKDLYIVVCPGKQDIFLLKPSDWDDFYFSDKFKKCVAWEKETFAKCFVLTEQNAFSLSHGKGTLPKTLSL